jgi:hypothetical protein
MVMQKTAGSHRAPAPYRSVQSAALAHSAFGAQTEGQLLCPIATGLLPSGHSSSSGHSGGRQLSSIASACAYEVAQSHTIAHTRERITIAIVADLPRA